MRYRQSLQVRLQERYRRLYKASFQSYHNEAAYLINFIRSIPALDALVSRLEDSERDLDPEAWVSEHFSRQGVELPPTEEGRAKLAWYLLGKWSKEPHASAMFGHSYLDLEANLEQAASIATEQIVEPFIEYMQERLGEASDVLYLLERYVRRVEWFERNRLWTLYQDDKSHGEEIFDKDLREFLFDQGIDYPFSQPRSASGEADVVGELWADDPLVCELKLFDGEGYGKSYIAKGFRQVIQYAHDYGKTTAYLVIINISEKHLELPSDGDPKDWPPRVEADGVTVFLVRVRGRPQPSASRQPKVPTVKLTRENLVGHLDED